MENKKIKIDESNNELYTLLCDVVNGLNTEIQQKNNYLNNNDSFKNFDPKQPYMQFRRGESVGLIIARDRLQALINNCT